MNELIAAAKAVIDNWDCVSHARLGYYVEELRAAVERAENTEKPHDVRRSKNPPKDLDQWLQSRVDENPCASPPYDEEIWTAAQQAERQRIKEIINYQFGELVSDLSEVMEMIDE